MAGRKTKFWVTNNILQYVLDIESHMKQCLALQSALSHPSIVDQAADSGYFWKEN